MTKPFTDITPDTTDNNPLGGTYDKQFAQLHARINALEQVPANQPSGQLVKTTTRPGIAAGPISITDPYTYLGTLLTTIGDLQRPLTDAEIVAYRDECKTAILALRAGHFGSTSSQTRDVIAYEAATRQAFVALMAVLFDNARSRDPYAAQLQFS